MNPFPPYTPRAEARGWNGHKPRPGRAALARRGFNTMGASRKRRMPGPGHAGYSLFPVPYSLLFMPDRPLRPIDRIERFVARALVRLPERVHVRLSGEPPVVVD